ncbi:hypothetical protein BANRA_02783 [Pseudomonas aeruginosa]|nr:hypothetical protein Q024_00993 [Pseudomonas aeruginosa BWHPSA011]MDA1400228.1 hypothetical protein [Pseudomonas aeruginosa]MDA1440147.1 hypothetical protein [Pseudomonas aeruginosa]VCW34015.1 hypothetical protein BANRA_00974 [Pseudomonas aeruginosa]VCZ02107.1 hypothetical protein BANRA_05668 [Pseudomonas aeruginosa]
MNPPRRWPLDLHPQSSAPASTGALRLEGEPPVIRTTTNRPRMAAIYAPGTVRARRWRRAWLPPALGLYGLR